MSEKVPLMKMVAKKTTALRLHHLKQQMKERKRLKVKVPRNKFCQKRKR